MRTIPKRVQNAYFQLKKSRLITKNEFDNDSILHFSKLLNSALPSNDYENIIYYLFKDLYYDEKHRFINYINNSNLQCLILYTDNKNIINHFNLSYKLYINWDKLNKVYIVEKYDSNIHKHLDDTPTVQLEKKYEEKVEENNEEKVEEKDEENS